ncbi:MAG: hypothetical protein LBU13_08925 [Synergistaceae bacterium]|jgi:hypothetical protein|nr:hypothetical protein [Synergistaceae bacterium]
MIGKIPDKRRDGKSSFRDLISYCLSKDPAKAIHVGHRNLLSPEATVLEMEAFAADNKRCKAMWTPDTWDINFCKVLMHPGRQEHYPAHY